MDIIKVAARSRSTAVAGAIAGVIREHGRAEVQAIGAGAVNQAIKATAIARRFLEQDGIEMICIPMKITSGLLNVPNSRNCLISGVMDKMTNEDKPTRIKLSPHP